MTEQEIRIAMWSGPRNISTAMMRSFENRPDTTVIDEPFYGHYLDKTGLNHPGREDVIASQCTDWDEIAELLSGPIPGGKPIWYQKHMAQHNLEECDQKAVISNANSETTAGGMQARFDIGLFKLQSSQNQRVVTTIFAAAVSGET